MNNENRDIYISLENLTEFKELNDSLTDSKVGAKYTKPQTGIPKTDLAQSVQDSLDLADSAIQTHQDITGKVNTSQVKNTMSTTAGDVYDVRYINNMIGDVETILTRLTTGSGV